METPAILPPDNRLGEWSRGATSTVFHFFPHTWALSLCRDGNTMFMPRTETQFTGIPPQACEECTRAYLEELTIEARLIYVSTGLLWQQSSDELKMIARYVCKKNSSLATELRRIRARVDALYTGGADPV